MRIGIDATIIFSSKPSGLGVYAINIINALFRIHPDIVVWTIDESNLTIDPKVVRTVLQPFKFMGNSLYSLRALWSETILPLEIRRAGIDLLFTVVPSGLTSTTIPHVMTVHDLIPYFYPTDVPLSVRLNCKYRLKRTVHNASFLFSVSEHTKQDIIAFNNIPDNRIQVIASGYDKNTFYPRFDTGKVESYGVEWGKYILYIGNASPRKNLVRLIKAFSRISSMIPHKLLLAGNKNPSELKQLTQCINSLGLNDRVVLHNYVSYNVLPILYSGADLFAYVSLYEGFGLPILEAMACGTPVVASSSTSLPEVAGNAAILVSPESEDEIARGILLLASNQEVKTELIERGFNRIGNYDWDTAAEQMLATFHSVMSVRL